MEEEKYKHKYFSWHIFAAIIKRVDETPLVPNRRILQLSNATNSTQSLTIAQKQHDTECIYGDFVLSETLRTQQEQGH